jgi:hypothetical protein
MPKNIIYHYIQAKFADNGHIYITSVYLKKSPPASTTASIVLGNLLQALAAVSLGSLLISSETFTFREAPVLWGTLITSRPQTHLHFSVDLESIVIEVGEHDVALVADHVHTHCSRGELFYHHDGDLADVRQSDWLFFLFIYWSSGKFFLS